jgi:hypothetical protein
MRQRAGKVGVGLATATHKGMAKALRVLTSFSQKIITYDTAGNHSMIYSVRVM